MIVWRSTCAPGRGGLSLSCLLEHEVELVLELVGLARAFAVARFLLAPTKQDAALHWVMAGVRKKRFCATSGRAL